MLAFIVWHKTVYAVGNGKRNRKQWREPKKVIVKQTPEQQATLSRLKASKWDSDSKDYTIYRINVPNETGRRSPSRFTLETIDNDCSSVGLSGPFFGQGKIGWQGIGSGTEKSVSSKIRRQEAETYLRGKLDILAQVRVLAGFDSQTEAYTIPDVPQELRDKWTFAQSSEIDRWNDYLAWKDESGNTVPGESQAKLGIGNTDMYTPIPTVYNSAAIAQSSKSQNEAFICGSEFTEKFGNLDKLPGLRSLDGKMNKPTPIVIPGRPMMQSEVDSLEQARDDVSLKSLGNAGSTDLATFKANYLAIMRAKRHNQQLRSTDCDILRGKDVS